MSPGVPRPPLLLVLAGLVALVVAPPPVAAFHFPWDQGHDTFQPEPDDDPNDPGDGNCNDAGSPFQVQSGNFFHKTEDLFISAPGLDLDITRSYNSLDRRNGPLGRGWVFTYDQRLIETTDGISLFAICRQGTGMRERYSRNPDGSYTGPGDIPEVVQKLPDGSFTVTSKDGVVRRMDASGKLVAVSDRHGNTVSFDYDAAGFLNQVTGPAGRALILTKGPNGKIVSVTDPAARVFRYDYDANANLTAVSDPAGNRTVYVYDSRDRLVQIIDPRGNTIQQVSYDAEGRVASFREQAEIWAVQYSPNQKRTTKRDSSGNTWTLIYNDNGNVVQRLDPFGFPTNFAYTADFNIAAITDPNGGTTQFTYDAKGNLLTRTDALGNASQFTYETDFNQVATATDALGRVTTFAYDARGNLVSITDPLGQVSRFTYDAPGNLTTTTDPLGNQSTLSYDSFGNLVAINGPLGNTTTLTYDLLGNIISITDPLGRVTTFEYDANQILNRPVRVIDPAGGVTESVYDASGNLLSIEDANGNLTLFGYDAFNRLNSLINPLGQTWVFAYDAKGNLTSTTDAKGQSFAYSYDSLSRLLVETAPDNTTSYSYDAAGNLLSVTDNDSSLNYSYDAVGRVISVETGASVAQPVTTISYSYDAVGNRISMTDPGGGSTAYVYDVLGRLTRITNPDSEVTEYAYDAISRLQQKSLANGASANWSYDSAGRVVGVTHDVAGVISSFSYTYDAAANRISAIESAGTNSYAYDAANRLVGASHPQATNPAESFNYDLLGNRLSSHLSSAYTYDAANRLLQDDTYDYSYDANGNQIGRVDRSNGDTTTYSYDANNRLVGVALPDGSSASYRYDGLGRRIEKRFGAKVVRYIYDNEDILLELDGANTVVARYTHGPGTDDPISQSRGGASFFYHADSVGSVREISDQLGAIVESYVYDSFGRIVGSTSGVENPYSFTGREADSESGLLFYRARYYDPSTGRFLQQDPLGFGGGANFYTYSLNDPVNHIDPFGLYGTRDCSYYDEQCKKYNGTYYCDWAPKWCDRFHPWDDKHWTRCVRKCLQDYDDKNCSPDQPCTDPRTESQVKKCNWKGHFFCYIKCAKDPGTDPNTGQPNPNVSPAPGLYGKTVADLR